MIYKSKPKQKSVTEAPTQVELPQSSPPKDIQKVSKVAPKIDYKKELARLTKGFQEEVAASIKADSEQLATSLDDGSYYQQIYFLIKKSFVVPSHINGPAGKNLQAIIRLFLLEDGNLANVALEHSSGDENFDQVVLNGTRRVNNFGAVPIALQSSLKNDGIVVEMCPFTCAKRRGG